MRRQPCADAVTEQPDHRHKEVERGHEHGDPRYAGIAALWLLQKIRWARFFISLGAGFVESVQKAVSNQGTDDLAVRASHLLEPLCNGPPILGATEKPAHVRHGRSLRENDDCTIIEEARGKGGQKNSP